MKTISRYIMTLALLLTAVTGAWATDGVKLTTTEIVPPTAWNEDHSYLLPSDMPGLKADAITEEQAKAWADVPKSGNVDLIYGYVDAENYIDFKIISFIDGQVNSSNSRILSHNAVYIDNVKYYYATGVVEPAIEVTPGSSANTWTFSMPGSDVVLTPIYAPTKVTLAANDKTMGTVEVAGESKVEWTADTWKGWTQNTKEHTVDDITITGTQKTSIYELTSEDKYKNSLLFFVVKGWDNSTVTFSTTGDPFSRIEFTMIDDYSQYNPNIIPNDNWTVEGKSAVWEGEATKSLTLQSCSTQVSKITFYKGAAIPDGVTINGDGTFTVAQTATVKVKAIPAEGYKLKGWSDAPDCTDLMREITIEPGEEDMIITANFEEMTYTATFNAANAYTIEAGKATVTVGGTDKTGDITEGKLEGVKMGSEVKMTAKEGYKFRKVEVKKKAAAAAAEGHALSASAVGEIVGSDGKAYAVEDKDNLPSGVTAVAMVAYKSGSNGLAIQLNGSPVEKEWDEAKTYAEGLSAVTGGTWRLPSKADWQNMFLGCAVSGDATSADDTMNPIAGFKAKIAATGITWKSFYYWSSTEHVMGAWSVLVSLDDSNAAFFDFHSTSSECTVLGCLAF